MNMKNKLKGKGVKKFGFWETSCMVCGEKLDKFFSPEEHIILHILQQKQDINRLVNVYKSDKKLLKRTQDYYEYMLRNVFKKRGK